MNTTLYWLTHDLRLDDNPALIRAANSDRLLCVYCIDPLWFRARRFQVAALGRHRWAYILQALQALQGRLQLIQQDLCIEYAAPEEALAPLISKHGVTRLVCSRQPDTRTAPLFTGLRERFPRLSIDVVDTGTLFNQEQLRDFAAGEALQQAILSTGLPDPIQAPSSLPPPPLRLVRPQQLPDWLPAQTPRLSFTAGEKAALHLLDEVLTNTGDHYETNLHDGETGSGLRAALNQGCLSSRRLAQRLKNTGQQPLSKTLLALLHDREYRHWQGLRAGEQLFDYQGMAGISNRAAFYPERYQKWCHGTTPLALVNACMRQLLDTGCLSEVGRRIAASYFVHELGLDWRYGAAWFQHQLIDYHPGSNWALWQATAGILDSSQPAQYLDLEQAAAEADPDGIYRQRWAPGPVQAHLDSVDAADWPIEP